MASLFLYDSSEFKKTAALFGKAIGIQKGQQKAIKSWKQLAESIRSHRRLDRLVFYFHGYDGGLIVGSEAYNLSESKIAKLFDGSRTTAKQIEFESCNMGNSPPDMAAIGKYLNAESVVAFTWYNVTQPMEIDVPQGATAQSIRDVLKTHKKWLMKGSPTAEQLATKATRSDHTVTLWRNWFRDQLDETPPEQARTLRNFKTRAEAQEVTMSASKLRKSNSSSPITPFEHVTVTF